MSGTASTSGVARRATGFASIAGTLKASKPIKIDNHPCVDERPKDMGARIARALVARQQLFWFIAPFLDCYLPLSSD
jgi:hypothetical protein